LFPEVILSILPFLIFSPPFLSMYSEESDAVLTVSDKPLEGNGPVSLASLQMKVIVEFRYTHAKLF
jgi:hypothetical protein